MEILIKVACRGGRLWFQCPGCEDLHCVSDAWSWEWPVPDDTDRVTISPSILVEGGSENVRCHSFLRDGRWEFLGDCTHALAGQTVDMVPLPEWFVMQDQ